MLAAEIERLVEHRAPNGSVAQSFTEYLDAVSRWPGVTLRPGFARADGPTGIQILSGDDSVGWAFPGKGRLQYLHVNPGSLVHYFGENVSPGDGMVLMDLRELRDVNDALRLLALCLEEMGLPVPPSLGPHADLDRVEARPRLKEGQPAGRGLVSARIYENRRGIRRVTVMMDIEEARRAARGDVELLRAALESAGVTDDDGGTTPSMTSSTDVKDIAAKLASIFDTGVPEDRGEPSS